MDCAALVPANWASSIVYAGERGRQIIRSRCGRHCGTMRGELRITSFLGCAGLASLAALPQEHQSNICF